MKIWIVLLLTGCQLFEKKVGDLAKKAIFQKAQPLLEKVLFAEAPLAPSNRSLFPTQDKLPGGPFGPRMNLEKNAKIDSNGMWTFLPGDYAIPVMTFCMKSFASSPKKHRYLLATMQGRLADVLRDLNARGLKFFSPQDIQMLSWAIQNGATFRELNPKEQQIVTRVIPEHQKRLQQSWFEEVHRRWNEVANMFPDFPRFENLTDETLDELGDVGSTVRATLEYRKTVQRYNHNYEKLSDLIALPGLSKVLGTADTTPWSKISSRIFARFLTEGHYQQIGRIELRIFARPLITGWNPLGLLVPEAIAESSDSVNVDPASWIGDPGVGNVQPLSFAAMIGLGLSEANPVVAAAVLAALVASAVTVDWNAVYDALEKGTAAIQKEVKELLDALTQMAHSHHDELEKGLKDSGVLDGAKDTTRNPKNNTRQYEKEGGKEQLKKDFDRLPYPETTAADGTKIKVAPDGTKYSEGINRNPPVLEVQPSGAGKGDDPTRIKVRYP